MLFYPNSSLGDEIMPLHRVETNTKRSDKKDHKIERIHVLTRIWREYGLLFFFQDEHQDEHQTSKLIILLQSAHEFF